MKNLISFYRDCYNEDRNRWYIQNVFNKDVEQLHFFDGQEDLLTGLLPFRFFDPAKAAALKKQAYLYRKEKEILYCSLFAVGIQMAEGVDKQRICAPLLMQNVRLEQENDQLVIVPEVQTLRFNNRLLEKLCESDEHYETAQNAIDQIVQNSLIKSTDVSQIAGIVQGLVSGIDITETIRFPELLDGDELKKTYRSLGRKRSTAIKMLPVSSIGLFKKKTDAAGVLNELGQMAEANLFSRPLQELFQDKIFRKDTPHKTGYVPSVLSSAQENILKSASSHTNTLVIGPPGTGKTYTIATLAMAYFSLGKSVLIASGKDQAVDVIAGKIEEQLDIKQCLVRGGRKNYLRDLKNYLQNLLSGLYKNNEITADHVEQLQGEIEKIKKRLKKQRKALKRKVGLELRAGRLAAQSSTNFWHSARLWFLKKIYKTKKPLSDTVNDINLTLNQIVSKIRLYLIENHSVRLEESLNKNRVLLNTFLKALRARTGGKKDDLFSKISFDVLFDIFPIWLVKLQDISRILPLKAELFDLVIIDEATQCDIASCIPVIQRAKRVVITGDPNQLRHLSFISRAKQLELFDKNQLTNLDAYDYRNKSILDLFSERINNQESVHFLNEHYRSLPQIIKFSNQNFYDSRLHIMTEKPLNYRKTPIVLNPCEGKRNNSGINEVEAYAVLEKIRQLIEDSPEPASIGVLSPFRNQVDFLNDQLSTKVDLSLIEEHKILVGTAHSFQGEERDIMLLSFVIDDDSHPNILRFLEKPDVFNVSITRAKNLQLIYHSVKTEHLPKASLLRKYLASVDDSLLTIAKTAANKSHDTFALQVQEALEQSGIKALLAHPVAGYMMDLVALKDDHSIGIDLIGFPGDFEDFYSWDRYKMFRRAGFKIFPLPYMQWQMNREECLHKISAALDNSESSKAL